MKTVILTIHRVLLLLFTVALTLMTPPWGTWGANSSPYCVPSSCGDFHNISAPFRLKGDPKGCGDPRYELVCENNRTVLYLYHGRYYVLSLFTYTEDHYSSPYYTFNHAKIRVVDDGLQKDNLSSLPLHSLSYSNFSYNDPYGYFYPSGWVSILNCSKPVVSPLYVAATAHNNCNVYAIVAAKASDVKDFCTVGAIVPISYSYDAAAVEENPLNSYDSIHNLMMDGLILRINTGPKGKTVRLCSFGPHTDYGMIFLERCHYKDYYLPDSTATAHC